MKEDRFSIKYKNLEAFKTYLNYNSNFNCSYYSNKIVKTYKIKHQANKLFRHQIHN